MAYLNIRDGPDDVRRSLTMYLRDVVLREDAVDRHRALIDEIVAR